MSRRTAHDARQPDLFGAPQGPAIDGWTYQRGFLDAAEEAVLLDIVQALPLSEMRYKHYTARRRGISFGGHYDFDANLLTPSPGLPSALHPLRARVAGWMGVAPESFTHVLVAEYRPGTPLGWHRDVPDFEEVVGVSLASDAEMRFRPYRAPPLPPPRADEQLRCVIERRSIYALKGDARWAWQHSVAPTEALRYSLTFRTPSARIPRPER